MTMISFTWRDDAGVSRTKTVELKDGSWVDPQLPIVILLHGLGGNINHMGDNPGVSPGQNFDVEAFVPDWIDRGWQWVPGFGIFRIEIDPALTVAGWQPFLTSNRYSSINYAQIDPNGLLARPVLELDALVRAVLARTSNRIVFVCHSRGGLLLRLFLQRNRQDVTLLRRIAGAVTLHSPHQGSGVADIATTAHTILLVLMFIVPMPAKLALLLLDSFVNAQGNWEMRTDSQLLANLRTSEATPLPVPIPIHTFGGTSPRLARVRSWVLDSWSAVPQWNWPPYHWRTYRSSVAGIESFVDGVPPLTALTAEERPGEGDTLVTDARSHLPGEASHHTNPLNHAQALWHQSLKDQVLPILRGLR